MNALVRRDDVQVSALAFTLRGGGGLPEAVPQGVAARAVRLPARVLNAAWARSEFPPISLLTHGLDVYHGTNFVLPPTGRAGGVIMIHDIAYLTMPDVVDDASQALRALVPRGLRRAAAVVDAVADHRRPGAGRLRRDGAGGGGHPAGGGSALVGRRGAGRSADRTRLGLPADYFLFVGTREPRKDLATLVAGYRGCASRPGPTPHPAAGRPIRLGTGADPGARGAGARLRADPGPGDDRRRRARAGHAVPRRGLRPAGTGGPGDRHRGDRQRHPGVARGHRRPGHGGVPGGRRGRLGAGVGRHPQPRTRARTGGIDAGSTPRGWTWDRCAERTMHAYRIAAGAG